MLWRVELSKESDNFREYDLWTATPPILLILYMDLMGIFLENDFWTPMPPLLTILYMDLTEGVSA